MPDDLKVITSGVGSPVILGAVWPDTAAVEGEYSLVQKIVKCLLTNPGEHEIDPDFGAGLRSIVINLTGADKSEAQRRMTSVLRKCVQDLQAEPADDPAERLVDLRLVGMEYVVEQTTWVASVEVETELTAFTIEVGA